MRPSAAGGPPGGTRLVRSGLRSSASAAAARGARHPRALAIVGAVERALAARARALPGARVHVVGAGPDARRVMRLLAAAGAVVSFSDPRVARVDVDGLHLRAFRLDNGYLGCADCVVIVAHRPDHDYDYVARAASLVVDASGRMASRTGRHIVHLPPA